MATQAQGRLLESPTDLHGQITHKLREDGLKAESTEQEKLIFLWKIYQHVEDDLQKARESENKLKEAQAEEMKEVENYVEHIRHLSDEREALIQELETENEALKAQVVSLEQGINEAAQAEITEMLTQQGLAKISDATQSEQIAYLLVERARLLDELEEHNNNSSSNNNSPNLEGKSSEAELKQILEQERGDFEEELGRQRESAKQMKEQLKQEHEEEINALMEENSKLEEDLQKAEMMVSQLKAELSRFGEGDDGDDSLSASLNRSLRSADDGEEKRKLKEERNQLNREREELEREMGEVEKERGEVKKEKDRVNQERADMEKERSSVNKERAKLEQLKSELDTQREELEQEREKVQVEREKVQEDRRSMEKKQIDVENKLEDLEHERREFLKEKERWESENKESPRAQSLRNGSPSRSSSDLALRKIIEEKTKIEGELVQLRTQLRSLQKEKDSHDDVVYKLKGDLEKSHLQQQQLQVKNRTLKAELQELETQLDEAETSVDSINKEKQSLSEKYDTLNSEVKTLRADAMKSSTLQDIVDILSNDKKQLSQSVESLKSKIEQTETEKAELANQNSRLSKEEQDLANQLQVTKQELERVTKERDELSGEKHELISINHKQEEMEKLLRADLEEMTKAKNQYVHQTESLSKENKDLHNKLDKVRDDLEAAKVQLQELSKQEVVIEHLKGQNEQLQTQVSSSNQELEKSKDRETMLISTQQSLQKSHDDTEKRYTQEIDDLKVKLELTLQELAKSRKECETLSGDKARLEDTLSRKQAVLDELQGVVETETRHKERMELEQQKVELRLAEQTRLADKFEDERKQRLELESQVSSLKDVEDSLKAVSRELEKEQKMRKNLETEVEELERTIASRVNKEDLVSAQDAADKERQLRNQLELRVKELEHTLKEVEISSGSASEQLDNERKLRLSLESNVKELQVALTQQGTAEELSRLREELHREREALREWEESKEDVQLLCGELEKERSLRAELTRKVAELEAAGGESPSSTLKATLDELERERRARAECDMRLQEAEQLLEDQRMESDTLHHSMSGKIMSLEKRVQALQEDLFNAQDELQAFQERYDEVVKEAEAARQEIVKHQAQRETMSAPGSRSHVPSTSSQHEEDLENSLISASAKLQETLNELNTVKSQLCEAQEELADSQVDIGNSRQEVELLKQSLEMSTRQLDQAEDEMRVLRRELTDTQGKLDHSQSLVKEKQTKLDRVVQDRDEIQRELDAMCDEQQQRVTPRPIDPAFYGEEERQEHVDRISTLEKLSRQLELDNREMARKLSDTMSRCETLEEQLQREKLRNTDKYQQSSRYTDQLEHDLDSANKHIRQLREELQQHQTKLFKLEADNLGLSAKYESSISRLEQDKKDLKVRHRQELDDLSQRMETSSTEARELRGQKRDTEQELSHLRLEVSRLKSNNERLENHLQAESKQKLDLENRNSVIDNEMTKVWSQVRSLMEKNAELESSNRSLEQDLNMKKSTMRQMETTLSQKEMTYEASTKAMVARAEAAEKKDFDTEYATQAEDVVDNAKDVQRELEEMTHKLLGVERQLAHADTGKVQLEDTKDKLVTIRNQLEGEKLQRTLLDQTVAELKHQVALLKQREAKVSTENKELQHTILDLESRLNQLQDKTSMGYDNHQQMSEVGKRSLMDQIARLQREVKELQYELYNVSERRDVDVKRYEERKLRTKAKLMKAREFYTTERSKYMEHMKHMDEDLRLTRATLSKELEWRDKMDDSYKQLLKEKRDLITQLSEAEENVRDKSRTLSMAQVRAQYLEEENSRLQDRLQTMTQQKHNLDKMVKDYSKREKSGLMSPREAGEPGLATSELGNSLDLGWGSNDHLDSLGHSWSPHIDPPANFRKSGNAGGGHVGTVVGDSTGGREDVVIVSNSRNIMDDDGGGDFHRGGGGKSKYNNSSSHRMRDSGDITVYPTSRGEYNVYTEIEEQDSHDFYVGTDEFEA